MTTAAPYPNPASPYGFDVDVGDDLQPDGRSASDAQLVANEIPHRLSADQLPLVGATGDFAPYGVDVRAWVGETTDQELANAKGPLLVMIVNRDPRIDRGRTAVQLQVQQDGDDYALTISIQAYLTNGLPIALVLGVSAVSVDLLSQGT